MNATVARIVEILFQNTEMNDEVAALKDEVLNNCQDRFEDMVARGLTEDEAIAAVVESLKGMEDVIAEYPKKQPDEEDDGFDYEDKEEEEGEADLTFKPEEVQKIHVNVISDDINVSCSEDDMVHVRYDREDMPGVTVSHEDGCVKVERMVNRVVNNGKQGVHQSVEINSKNGRVVVNGKSFDVKDFATEGSDNWDTFSSMMRGIGHAVRQMTSGIRIKVGSSSGELYIDLPAERYFDFICHTTGGDVEISEVQLGNVQVETTSGDITLDQDEPLKTTNIKTTSGDVELIADCEELTVQTMSGDVTIDGTAPQMNLTTISGDMEARGGMVLVNAKTTSGDMTIEPADACLRELNAKTISGDVHIELPDALLRATKLGTKTISGDVSRSGINCDEGEIARVKVETISGDINVE